MYGAGSWRRQTVSDHVSQCYGMVSLIEQPYLGLGGRAGIAGRGVVVCGRHVVPSGCYRRPLFFTLGSLLLWRAHMHRAWRQCMQVQCSVDGGGMPALSPPASLTSGGSLCSACPPRIIHARFQAHLKQATKRSRFAISAPSTLVPTLWQQRPAEPQGVCAGLAVLCLPASGPLAIAPSEDRQFRHADSAVQASTHDFRCKLSSSTSSFFINLRYEEACFCQHPIHPARRCFFQDPVLKSRR